MSVGDLDIIAEHVVICHLERGDSGQRTFTLLKLQKIVLAFVGNLAQFVKLAVDPFADHRPTIDGRRRIRSYLALYPCGHFGAGIELTAYAFQRGLAR